MAVADRRLQPRRGRSLSRARGGSPRSPPPRHHSRCWSPTTRSVPGFGGPRAAPRAPPVPPRTVTASAEPRRVTVASRAVGVETLRPRRFRSPATLLPSRSRHVVRLPAAGCSSHPSESTPRDRGQHQRRVRARCGRRRAPPVVVGPGERHPTPARASRGPVGRLEPHHPPQGRRGQADGAAGCPCRARPPPPRERRRPPAAARTRCSSHPKT